MRITPSLAGGKLDTKVLTASNTVLSFDSALEEKAKSVSALEEKAKSVFALEEKAKKIVLG